MQGLSREPEDAGALGAGRGVADGVGRLDEDLEPRRGAVGAQVRVADELDRACAASSASARSTPTVAISIRFAASGWLLPWISA